MTTQDTKFEEQDSGLVAPGLFGIAGQGCGLCRRTGRCRQRDWLVGDAGTGKHAFQQNDEQYAEAVNNPPKVPDYNWNDHQWAMGVDTDSLHRLSALHGSVQDGKQCADGRESLSHLG